MVHAIEVDELEVVTRLREGGEVPIEAGRREEQQLRDAGRSQYEDGLVVLGLVSANSWTTATSRIEQRVVAAWRAGRIGQRPKPAGLAVGDLVVVFLTYDAAQWVSAPSGFGYGDTCDNYGSGMSPQMRAEFWWKTATSSDVSGTGWTFTVSGPPASTSTAVGAAFRGVNTATGADLGSADGNFSNSGTGGWSDNWSANSTATSLTVPGSPPSV